MSRRAGVVFTSADDKEDESYLVIAPCGWQHCALLRSLRAPRPRAVAHHYVIQCCARIMTVGLELANLLLQLAANVEIGKILCSHLLRKMALYYLSLSQSDTILRHASFSLVCLNLHSKINCNF